MSMKNRDTWDFAHHYCGNLWFRCGLAMLFFSIIVMMFLIGKDDSAVGGIGGILCAIQMVPFIGAMIPTEIALKKNFDGNGNKR